MLRNTLLDPPSSCQHRRQHSAWRNRLWRGWIAFFPDILTRHYQRNPRLNRADVAFVCTILTPAEHALYSTMDHRDQHHALWVARSLHTQQPHLAPIFLAVALLHDVGKASRPFCPWQRVGVHLLANLGKALGYNASHISAYPRKKGWRGAWQDKWHHEHYGAQMIVGAGGRPAVARLVAALAHEANEIKSAGIAGIANDDITNNGSDSWPCETAFALCLLKHIDAQS